MPALKPISREYRIYLALWRKAFKLNETVRFQASTWAMAIAMRQGMYRAIRPFRTDAMLDQELREAAEKFVVVIEKQPDPKVPHWIVIKPRMTLSELEASLHDFGLDEDDLLFGDERLIDHALQDLIEEEAAPPKATPFYQREQ